MKDNSTKIIAMYLPQFHETDENNKWWGKGYTDWVAVRKNKPLFKGHNQPRIPLNNNYYDLTDQETLIWQSNLAQQYGIYGFGIYHYWFSSKQQLLTKPAEIILNTPEFKTHFCFCWDNGNWKRTWSNVRGFSNDWAPTFDENKDVKSDDNGLLAELIYGNEDDWKKHFDYLLPFFKDERYIKIDNKPVFQIFQPGNQFDVLKKMQMCWNKWAIEAGFNGICFCGKTNLQNYSFGYGFQYSPDFFSTNKFELWKTRLHNVLNRHFKPHLRFCDYDKTWKRIISNAKKKQDYYYCGFVRYDDTPRRGLKKGTVVKNESVEKFEKYLNELLQLSIEQDKEFLFLTAWNEWGEGAYLEPDSVDEYKYLEAVKRVVDRNKK